MYSRKLKRLIEEMKYINRNPQDVELLEMLDDISKNPTRTIEPKNVFYRCRVVETDLEFIDVEIGFKGYDSVHSFVAPAKKLEICVPIIDLYHICTWRQQRN